MVRSGAPGNARAIAHDGAVDGRTRCSLARSYVPDVRTNVQTVARQDSILSRASVHFWR